MNLISEQNAAMSDQNKAIAEQNRAIWELNRPLLKPSIKFVDFTDYSPYHSDSLVGTLFNMKLVIENVGGATATIERLSVRFKTRDTSYYHYYHLNGAELAPSGILDKELRLVDRKSDWPTTQEWFFIKIAADYGWELQTDLSGGYHMSRCFKMLLNQNSKWYIGFVGCDDSLLTH